MKKLFLYVISATIGICIATMLHLSFMMVEAKGIKMLPTIEPGQKVIVCLVNNDVATGDIIAYKTPFYSLEGEGYIVFRRVREVADNNVVLTCDIEMMKEHEITISKDDILGKVLLINNN